MSVNNENEFRKLILDSADTIKGIHKIDLVDELKRVLHRYPDLARFVVQKPYDFGLLKGGKYLGIELKNEPKYLTWNISAVEDHQLKYLKEVEKCGGRGLILVRFKRGVDSKEKKRLGLPANKWAIDTTFILPVRELLATKLTSFTYEYLQEHFDVLEFNKYTKKYDMDLLWKKTNPKKP